MRCSEPLFTTARLAVRLYRADDFAAHARLRADSAVTRFMHWDEAVADFPAHIEGWRNRRPPDSLGWINLAVEDARAALVGDLGVLVEGGRATFGLALKARARGMGLGRELACGAMDWLEVHGVTRFRVEIDDANIASVMLFRGLGFAPGARKTDRFGPYSVYDA